MKKIKLVKSDGIQLPSDKVIKSQEEGESYKYLGVLEADEVMVNEMKHKVKKIWAVSVVRYSAAFLGWSRLQIEEIDRRTRKLLTMHNGFYPKSNVDRLYLSRSEGGRGLIRVQDTADVANLG